MINFRGFSASVKSLPAGHYQVFRDIARERSRGEDRCGGQTADLLLARSRIVVAHILSRAHTLAMRLLLYDPTGDRTQDLRIKSPLL